MKLISKKIVPQGLSIPNFLKQKGYSPNFDYILYTYARELPVDVYVLFADNNFILYIKGSILKTYQSTSKHLVSDVLEHFNEGA